MQVTAFDMFAKRIWDLFEGRKRYSVLVNLSCDISQRERQASLTKLLCKRRGLYPIRTREPETGLTQGTKKPMCQQNF